MKDYDKFGTDFLEKYELEMDCIPQGIINSPWGDKGKVAHYRITIRQKDIEHGMTFPFYCGLGIEGQPTAYDVLTCSRSDFSAYDNARDKDDFIEEFGYDQDGVEGVRRGERVWEQIEEQKNDFDVWFGEGIYQALLDTEDLS